MITQGNSDPRILVKPRKNKITQLKYCLQNLPWTCSHGLKSPHHHIQSTVLHGYV